MVERGPTIEPAHEYETILSQDFVDVIMQGARENLADHGNIGTTLYIRLESGERGVVPLSMPGSHEEKRMYFTLLGLSFLESGRQIREAILVAESWYVEASEGDYPHQVAPSQHPQRKEAITLAGRDSKGQQFVFAIQPFQRNLQNQPIFDSMALEQFDEQPNDSYYSTGLLDNLFLVESSRSFC